MLTIYKTLDGRMQRLDAVQDGCWVDLIHPTEEELRQVALSLDLDQDFLRAALDEEETSRVEREDGQTLITIDLPAAEETEPVIYSTFPLGILVTDKCIVTVCTRESSVLRVFEEGTVRQAQTQKRTSFIFHLLLQVAKRYLYYLRQIDRIYSQMEKKLSKSQRNKEIIQLFEVEKSLVYFNASLKADKGTLEKLLRGRIIPLYEEDQDLLEDVLIEVNQAIEMTGIYSSIISNMKNAFTSVSDNNLNVMMKFLAAVTILLELPNMVFGFYGMNVAGLPLAQWWWVPLVLSVVLVAVTALILKKTDLF